jgi:hypothetical protein
MVLKFYLLSFLISLFLLGCGGQKAPVVPITYDASVPEDQKALLQSDLNRLATLDIKDMKDANLMDIPDFTPSSLYTWLSDRVKYIVGENYDKNKITSASQLALGNLFNAPFFNDDNTGKVKTVMSNMSAGIYMDNRSTRTVVAIDINGQKVNVTSTRAGVIQIGEGLFTIDSYHEDDTSAGRENSRLGTLIHEGRHSDGNFTGATGENGSLSFGHAMCPDTGITSGYKGRYACDRFLNGAYPVGGLFLKKELSVCFDCTLKARINMMLEIADQYSRVLPGATLGDGKPDAFN